MIGPSFPAVLAAAQTGDERAFAVMWRARPPAVLRCLRVPAPTAAEDLAADTWVSVIRGLGRFRGDERAFRAWVFTATRHRAVDWHRQAARRWTQPLPVGLPAERTAPDDPAAAVLEAQSTRAAYELIAELPRAQAEVLALRILGGTEVAEVAPDPRQTPRCGAGAGLPGHSPARSAAGGGPGGGTADNTMSHPDGLPHDMRQPLASLGSPPPPVDWATLDRLLAGRLHPGDAPPLV